MSRLRERKTKYQAADETLENGGNSGDNESDSSLQDVAVQPITIQPLDEEEEHQPAAIMPQIGGQPLVPPVDGSDESVVSQVLMSALAASVIQQQTARFPVKPQENDLAGLLKQQAKTELLRFHCPQCKKYFRTKHTFNKHMTEHDIHCKICKHTAVSRNELTIHYRQYHEDELPYKCDKCHGRFGFEDTLQYHISNQHKDKENDSNVVQPVNDLREMPFLCTDKNCFETFNTAKKCQAHTKLCYLMTKPSARKRIVDDDEPKNVSESAAKGQKVSKPSKMKEEDEEENMEEGSGEMFSCLICGQQFKSHNIMFKHMYRAHDIGSDSGGDDDEDADDTVVVLDSPSPPRSKPGPASSKRKNRKQNGNASSERITGVATKFSSTTSTQQNRQQASVQPIPRTQHTENATDLITRLLTQDSETRQVLQSVQASVSTSSTGQQLNKSQGGSISFEKMVADILKENEDSISKIYNEQKQQENMDFDTMVANILSEHKDEIRKNVEQQQLITRGLQKCQQVDTKASSNKELNKLMAKFMRDNQSTKSQNDSSSSNTSSRSNSPVVPVGKSVPSGAGSSLRGILTSPPKVAQPVQIINDVGPASSALLGLLNQPPTIRTLSPFPKPPLSSALEAARYAPNLPRRSAPVQNRRQQNVGAAGAMSSALISAIASSAAKDALTKYGTNRPVTTTTMPTTPTKSGSTPKKDYDKEDKDFRSKAKPGASSVSTRPKRGKQRMDFSDLLHESESEEEEESEESEGDSDEYRSKPKVKRRTRAKMSQSDAEDSDCDSQWKHLRKRRKVAVHMRSCVVEWLEGDGKSSTSRSKDKRTRTSSKKPQAKSKEETQKTPSITTMSRTIETQVEMVNKLLAHLQKNSKSGKDKNESISDVIKETEEECSEESAEEVGMELVYRLFYQSDTVLKRNLQKRVQKHNEWKKQISANGEGSDKEMDAYDRSPAFRKVMGRKPRKERNKSESPQIVHQSLSPHKSIMGLMKVPISPQRGLKSPVSSMSMGNSPAWSTLQILNMQAHQSLVPGLVTPQIYMDYDGHNVRNRTAPKRIDEVITIDDDSDDDDNGKAKDTRNSPPLFKISDTFSLNSAQPGQSNDIGNFHTVQGIDNVNSVAMDDAISAVDRYGEMKAAQGNRRVSKTVPPCKLCGKRFDRFERYEAHMLSHQGLKANPCTLCKKKYARRDALRNHVKQNHPNEFKRLYGPPTLAKIMDLTQDDDDYDE